MPKKEEKHGNQHTDDFILAALLRIEQAIGRTNGILRKTEKNNQERHEELLKALANPDASRVVYTKIRREPIPKP